MFESIIVLLSTLIFVLIVAVIIIGIISSSSGASFVLEITTAAIIRIDAGKVDVSYYFGFDHGSCPRESVSRLYLFIFTQHVAQRSGC